MAAQRRPVGKRQSRPVQSRKSEGSTPSGPTTHTFIHVESAIPRAHFRRNRDYKLVEGTSKYEHIEIWSAHHRIRLDGKRYIIHHKDEVKTNNEVCERPAPCPVLDCGNLGPMTRADHIREHRPGKMSGQKGLRDTYQRTRRKA